MNYTFDYQEVFTRVVKYLIEGLAVGFVAAFILPKNPLPMDKVFLLGLTAAAMFAVLDLVAPSIGSAAYQGAGLGLGFKLIGFPGP